MEIQWFPGHMAKTRRLIREHISQVDIVVELLDARIPGSSRNPEIDALVGNKPRIICLNKCDMADETNMAEWENFYKSQDSRVRIIRTNSSDGSGVAKVKTAALALMKDKLDASLAKGRLHKSVRLMIVGIPNVGKSSLINRLTKRAVTQTGNRPGVTKAKQWVRIDKDLELLDTPGILWPKFEDKEVGLNLAITGAIKDEIMDVEELACMFLAKVYPEYKEKLFDRYKFSDDDVVDLDFCTNEIQKGAVILEVIGRKRGCIISGGNVDYNRAANIVLDEFRSGKMGMLSLEVPGR